MNLTKDVVLDRLRAAGEAGLRSTDLLGLFGLERAQRTRLDRLLHELGASGQVVKGARGRFHLAGYYCCL